MYFYEFYENYQISHLISRGLDFPNQFSIPFKSKCLNSQLYHHIRVYCYYLAITKFCCLGIYLHKLIWDMLVENTCVCVPQNLGQLWTAKGSQTAKGSHAGVCVPTWSFKGKVLDSRTPMTQSSFLKTISLMRIKLSVLPSPFTTQWVRITYSEQGTEFKGQKHHIQGRTLFHWTFATLCYQSTI